MTTPASEGRKPDPALAKRDFREIDRALDEQESVAAAATQFRIIFGVVVLAGAAPGWLIYSVWRDGSLGTEMGELAFLLAFVWILTAGAIGISIPVLRRRRRELDERVDRLLGEGD